MKCLLNKQRNMNDGDDDADGDAASLWVLPHWMYNLRWWETRAYWIDQYPNP